MYAVYKVTGQFTNSTYYGYKENCDSSEDAKQGFLTGATRKEQRGDVMFIEQNDGNNEDITVTIVDVVDDEFEAMCSRNEFRASDIESVTGPTFWPFGTHRVDQDKPGASARWKRAIQLREATTARQAWKLGAFAGADMKKLRDNYNRNDIVRDLDKLTPKQFSETYCIFLGFADGDLM